MSTKLYDAPNEEGGTNTYVLPDGFRPRKTREEGWLAIAIARGEVADPDNPIVVKRARNANDKVIEVPTATIGSIAHTLREE